MSYIDYEIQGKSDENLAVLVASGFILASVSANLAYTELFNRYRSPLLGFIKAHFYKFYFMPDFLSEDIVQEAFLRALININKFNPSKKWKTWLYRIAINIGYEFLRKYKLLLFVSDFSEDFPDTGSNLEQNIDFKFNREKIFLALSKLPETSRKLLEMHYFLNLNQQQICLALKIKHNSFHLRLDLSKRQFLLLISATNLYL